MTALPLASVPVSVRVTPAKAEPFSVTLPASEPRVSVKLLPVPLTPAPSVASMTVVEGRLPPWVPRLSVPAPLPFSRVSVMT